MKTLPKIGHITNYVPIIYSSKQKIFCLSRGIKGTEFYEEATNPECIDIFIYIYSSNDQLQLSSPLHLILNKHVTL